MREAMWSHPLIPFPVLKWGLLVQRTAKQTYQLTQVSFLLPSFAKSLPSVSPPSFSPHILIILFPFSIFIKTRCCSLTTKKKHPFSFPPLHHQRILNTNFFWLFFFLYPPRVSIEIKPVSFNGGSWSER